MFYFTWVCLKYFVHNWSMMSMDFRKVEYNIFNLSRDLKIPPHWRIIQIYEWELLAICYHYDKFNGHKHHDSGDMFFICHVTTCLKDYVNLYEEALDSKSPLYHIWWPLAQCKRRYKVFNLSHDLTRPRDWRIKRYHGWEPLIICYHPVKFGSSRHCVSRDMFLNCHVISLDHAAQK